jgi:hypothetical protein
VNQARSLFPNSPPALILQPAQSRSTGPPAARTRALKAWAPSAEKLGEWPAKPGVESVMPIRSTDKHGRRARSTRGVPGSANSLKHATARLDSANRPRRLPAQVRECRARHRSGICELQQSAAVDSAGEYHPRLYDLWTRSGGSRAGRRYLRRLALESVTTDGRHH